MTFGSTNGAAPVSNNISGGVDVGSSISGTGDHWSAQGDVAAKLGGNLGT